MMERKCFWKPPTPKQVNHSFTCESRPWSALLCSHGFKGDWLLSSKGIASRVKRLLVRTPMTEYRVWTSNNHLEKRQHNNCPWTAFVPVYFWVLSPWRCSSSEDASLWLPRVTPACLRRPTSSDVLFGPQLNKWIRRWHAKGRCIGLLRGWHNLMDWCKHMIESTAALLAHLCENW